MLSRLEFGSSDVYAPQGTAPISKRSKERTNALKGGKAYAVIHYARRAMRLAGEGEFPGFFGKSVTLVPVCRSSPLATGWLWVPHLLAQEMQRLGMAQDVSLLLTRTKAVAKSAAAKPENRPSPLQHYESMRAELVAPAPTRIVLVDDVVTRGATLLAAASRLAEAYPNAEIRAYAAIRTMSRQEIETWEVPCVGLVTGSVRATHRDP